MTEWRKIRVGDLGTIITGRTPPSTRPELFGDSFPFITPTDIVDDNRYVRTGRFVSDLGGDYLNSIALPPRSVSFVCIGATIGKICLTGQKSYTNQQLNSVIVHQRHYVPEFVYYLLRTYTDAIKAQAAGAATPIVNKTNFSNVEVLVPPLHIQRRIAAILGAYDDLIDVNRRRIALLEEMARRLFDEWFVHFRFPGHEGHKMVETNHGRLPEGWGIQNVEHLVRRLPVGKKYEQKTVARTGRVPVLDQGRSGVIGFHDEEPGVHASEAKPVIVFANHTCYQRLVHFPFSAIQNVLPFVPHPRFRRNIYWLHWATKGLVTLNDYKGHWPEFVSKSIPIPVADLCERFGTSVRPLELEAWILERTNLALARARDLLLPRLVSGELPVIAAEHELEAAE